ncbi:hypothetical protein [Halorubrum lipolyticum]|uniref:hypothetical protein n=1 Tax=Halorubrum lipolyticum TaxID=368624 RepID=UPI00135F1734|nr:hypothetical protein [Halorubrum lipolyticum]
MKRTRASDDCEGKRVADSERETSGTVTAVGNGGASVVPALGSADSVGPRP